MNNIGCRIFTDINRPSTKLIEKFRGLPVANIGDNMNRLFCVDSSIHTINNHPVLGPAFTIHAPSGDNLMLHKAFELAQPGDVIVIASGGYERAFTGGLMTRCAMNLKLGGFVIDGCIRDEEDIKTLDFPVFAKGVTPQGPYKNGPGEINVPIAFGGQVVFPGDIVVGDGDGLLFIRPSEADAILEKAWAQFHKEERYAEACLNGSTAASYDPVKREETLAKLGCEIINNTWK